MTNHNGIWYESGRTARYGGECNGDLATLERCFPDAIKEGLKLTLRDGVLSLKAGGTSMACIELNETTTNWTDLAPNVQLTPIVRLDMSRCGLHGALSSTRTTERLRVLLTFYPV